MTDTRGITPEVAAHVLFEFDRPGGYPGGRWTRSLIEAIVHADANNRALLAVGFAGYVRAVRTLQQREDGVMLLQRLAAGPAGGES